MFAPQRKILIGSISTSEHELKDIARAWVLVSVAFGILLRHNIGSFALSFLLAFLTVGVGFLLHELAHKLVAQHYGCFAEFRAFDMYLWLAILMSFFGFVIAAPGAVFITGPVGVKRNGIISVAGPLTNIALALVFLSIWFLGAEGWVAMLAYYGFYINSWLALFNMLPFWNFDGAKVWPWNKGAYGLVVGSAILLMFMQNVISV
jgi:Zn-dependent protease